MSRQHHEGIVLRPVAADIGSYRQDAECFGVEAAQVIQQIIRPLVAQASVFEVNIHQKIMHPRRGGDPVAPSQRAAEAEGFMGKRACFVRIDGAVHPGDHATQLPFIGRVKRRDLRAAAAEPQRHKQNPQPPYHCISPCGANVPGKTHITYASASSPTASDHPATARG